MASIRRYGPVLGAGTTLTEQLSGQTIQPSPLGVVAWSGILEKGPVDELIEINSDTDFTRKCGGRTPDSYVPDCNEDYWSAGRGAGKMFLVRVTDGTERESVLTFYSREFDGEGFGRWRPLVQLDAKSGGRWAGARNRRIEEITGVGDLTETTIDTGLTLLEDEFSGGSLVMTEITGETFEVIGNTTAGIVTLRPDAQLLTKYGAGTDNEFVLEKDNTDTFGNTKNLTVLWKDGERDPETEFGLEVYQNGTKLLDYGDLSLAAGSDKEIEEVINNDLGNHELEVTNLFTGTYTPATRPANQSGSVVGVTATELEIEWFQAYGDSGNTGDGVLGTGVAGTDVQRDFLTLTCTSVTVPGSEVWSVESANQDRDFPDATTAVIYAATNKYSMGFTITVGATPFALTDKLYVIIEPIVPAEAIGGRVFYDTDTLPRNSYEIISATETAVRVRVGIDLAVETAIGEPYRLQFPESLERGYDGASGVDDNDRTNVYDNDSSLFNRMKDKKLGLVKYANPGGHSTTVQKATRKYAEDHNGPYREEMPDTILDEVAAITWTEDTMGRNDFAQTIFPSWYYKVDPDRAGVLKLVPLTGLVQGVESFFAYSWQGYHKAAAGTDAVLDGVVKIPTGEKVIDDEQTNPKGIQSVQKKDGNFVIWGDKVPATSTGLIWKHKREQLSHYERILMENMDWILFAISDEDKQDDALAALQAFFIPEWKPKGAVRGATFEDAVSIKIDSENNTDATLATGDVFCGIRLRLADVIERFNIIISPAGIFESVAA